LFSCADISITSKDNHFLSTTAQNPLVFLPFNNPVVATRSSMMVYLTTSTNSIFPFRPSKELIDQVNKTNKSLRCYPTNEALKPLIGIESWCLQLCAVHCPPTLCVCVQI
jgi:hypothetical protein